MNNKEYVSKVAAETGYSVSDAQEKLSKLIHIITEQLQESNNVVINNFGTFEVKKKNERVSVNPITKKRLLIPPKLVMNFKPAPSVKDKLKEDK